MTHFAWLHLSDLHYGNPKDSWDAEDIRETMIEKRYIEDSLVIARNEYKYHSEIIKTLGEPSHTCLRFCLPLKFDL